MAYEVIPVIKNIDYILSEWGGLVRGSMIEVFGPDGSGKTTFALLAEKAAQKLGLPVGHVDVEYSLVPDRASALGVNMETLDWQKPSNGEEALSIVHKMCQERYGLVVLDSVAGLLPKPQRERLQDQLADNEFGSSEGGQFAAVAGLLSRTLSEIRNIAIPNKVAIILINQVRANFQKFGMGPETDSFGGYAIKHYVDSRFELRRVGWIKYSNRVVGFRDKIRAPHKNRFAVPNRESFFSVSFDPEFKYIGDLDNMVEREDIEFKGGFYIWKGQKFRGNKVPEELIKILEE